MELVSKPPHAIKTTSKQVHQPKRMQQFRRDPKVPVGKSQ